MKVINFFSVKGGVGKSSLTFLSGKFLSSKGKKTLLIDLDPQRSISKTLGFPGESLAYSWLLGDSSLSESIKETETENLFLLPGSLKLLKIGESVNQNFIQEELETLQGFDYVLIDNQPTWNSIVRAGIQASTKVVVPSLVSFFDLEEVGFVLEESKKVNKKIEMGIVLNRVVKAEEGTKEEEEYLDLFKEEFSGALLSSRIPNSNLVRKAIDRGENFLEGKSSPKRKFSEILRVFLEEVTGEGFQPSLFGGTK
jgi:chromosome partitioning protein